MQGKVGAAGKAVLQVAFAVAFVGSLAVTVHLLLADKTASATVAAVLTLSMGLFCFLPTLESFTAFGLSAQFRKTLDEAERILALLREQASISGRIQVGTIASANRFTTGGYEQKMQQVDMLCVSLRKLGVPDAEIDDLKAPYIRNICFDTARVYLRELERHAAQKTTDLNFTFAQAFNAQDREQLADLEPRIALLKEIASRELTGLNADQIVTLLDSEKRALEARDERDFDVEKKRELEHLRVEVLAVIAEARANGNITAQGNRFLVAHRAA